ncbi:MBL fold metallo-hydrolase [Thermodesulfobacteriota bacterium]
MIQLGNANAWLLEGQDGYLLVDAGVPRKEGILFSRLREEGIDPGLIRLIVITHVHYDHVGSLAAILEECRCPVAVHETEADLLREGTVVIPPGTRWFSRPGLGIARKTPLLKSLLRFRAVEPDILVRDAMSLDEFGFSDRILHTPGHTYGSVSVLSERGEAVVGDLVSNDWPFRMGPIFNPFGEDGAMMLDSWERLIREGARTILPSHGKPFPVEKLKQVLLKRQG